MLPRNSHSSRDVMQRQMSRKFLPDKLLHFGKHRFRGRVRPVAASHRRGEIAYEDKAEAQVKARLQGLFGKRSEMRSPAHLQERMHPAGKRNRSSESSKFPSQSRGHC